MLETFINLADALSEEGKISEAAMNVRAGLITIDGVTDEGRRFHLTYRYEEKNP